MKLTPEASATVISSSYGARPTSFFLQLTDKKLRTLSVMSRLSIKKGGFRVMRVRAKRAPTVVIKKGTKLS